MSFIEQFASFMKIADEYLCPSLLMECELRLLSSKPYSCFCCCCSPVMKKELMKCVSIKGPSKLIHGPTALSVLIDTQYICSSPIHIDENFVLRRKFVRDLKVKNIVNQQDLKSRNDQLSSQPFYFVKLASLCAIIREFRAVEKCDTYIDFLQQYLKEFDNLSLQNMALKRKEFSREMLFMCLNELFTSIVAKNDY